MKRGQIALAGAAILTVAIILIGVGTRDKESARAHAALNPVMSVAVTRAQSSMLPIRVPATGHVVAWQEASVGAEANGLRLTDVRVNVGDAVKRGEVLALFDDDVVDAEFAESTAMVAQAEASALEAEVNYRRAKGLDVLGAMSAQQVGQYEAGAKTGRARVEAARAVEQRNRLRLTQTRVLAPGDGIITSRTATVGAVVAAGQELFRMIKDGRLEWRAEVSAADLERLRPGQVAKIVQGHESIQGELRMVAPTIDMETLSGLAYVDLPRHRSLRAGAFVRGYFEIGNGPALTVPQSAVLLRDGFHYVMRVGPKSDVIAKKVSVGRRAGDRIEITQGLSTSEVVIASGLSFLSDGDTVRIVEELRNSDARMPTGSNPARLSVEATERSGS